MGKVFAAFLMLFIAFSYLSGVMAGGDGFVITTLHASVHIGDMTVEIAGAGGLLDSGTVWVDSEELQYASITAGVGFDTLNLSVAAAADHLIPAGGTTQVYSNDANAASYALGFDLAKTVSKAGLFTVVIAPWAFFGVCLPRLIYFNWQFMSGDLAWVAIPFFVAGAGMVVSFIISMMWTATGVLRVGSGVV